MPTRKPKPTNWKKRAESAEAQVEQLVGDIKAVSQDYTDAKKALDAAERHNAELLRERDMWESANKTVCPGCFRHECRGECMRPVRFHDGGGITELPVVPKDAAVIEQPEVPWIVRHLVELIMATVLGAIGFVVWRAWH